MRFRTRMIARLALVVGIALVTAGYSKCVFVSNTGRNHRRRRDRRRHGGIVGTFSTTLVLRDSAGVATTSFVFGEPIRFDLEARNQSAQPVTLTFPDAQIYDFVVLDSRLRPASAGGGPRTWHSRRWPPSSASSPNSSKAYSVLWSGVLSDGTQLPPGNYRAQGMLVSDDVRERPHRRGRPGFAPGELYGALRQPPAPWPGAWHV